MGLGIDGVCIKGSLAASGTDATRSSAVRHWSTYILEAAGARLVTQWEATKGDGIG